MTTIAYDGEIVAVDSRTCAGSCIISDKNIKIYKSKGVVFACSGNRGQVPDMISAYFGEKFDEKADIIAIIDDHGKIFSAGINQDGFWKCETTGEPYAIGSGEDYALAAMDLGCNAIEAVKCAMKRDIYTGGRIRFHRIKK